MTTIRLTNLKPAGLSKVLTLPGCFFSTKQVLVVSFPYQNHTKHLRLITSIPVPILRRSNQFYSPSLREDEEEECNNTKNISSVANVSQNTRPSLQINIVFPQTVQLGTFGTFAMLWHLFTKLLSILEYFLFLRGIFFKVAVLDKDQALRRKLNKIVEYEDTSTLGGLGYVFQAVVVALLQCNDSSFHFVNLRMHYDLAMCTRKVFKEILDRELDRHEKRENALINVDDKAEYNNKGSTVIADGDTENEYTVLTVCVLATGEHWIPLIKEKEQSYLDIVEVLRTLRRIKRRSLQSVKIFWSPRKDGAVLLEDELERYVPRMQRIKKGRIIMKDYLA